MYRLRGQEDGHNKGNIICVIVALITELICQCKKTRHYSTEPQGSMIFQRGFQGHSLGPDVAELDARQRQVRRQRPELHDERVRAMVLA